MARGFATLGDVYGPDAGATFDAAELVGPTTTTQQTMSDSSGPALRPIVLFPGLQGINPLVGILVVLGAIVGIKLLREWKASEGDVKDIKAGAYSLVMVTLMAAAGLPLLKGFLAKYHVPGVSEYVLNA